MIDIIRETHWYVWPIIVVIFGYFLYVIFDADK